MHWFDVISAYAVGFWAAWFMVELLRLVRAVRKRLERPIGVVGMIVPRDIHALLADAGADGGDWPDREN